MLGARHVRDCWLSFDGAAYTSKATDCPLSCSGNGGCNDQLDICRCFENYRGATCELFVHHPVPNRACY